MTGQRVGEEIVDGEAFVDECLGIPLIFGQCYKTRDRPFDLLQNIGAL